MNDTPREIAQMVREKLMARPGAERLMMGSRMFEAARTMILASFPAGLSEVEIRRRLCERLYGGEVNVEAFIESLLKAREKNDDA
ncbi:MAG: hypothetical protein H0T64_04760 [Pyrinomonadaceae bacterium]|jgi:hypothetical protein|nr:hypothetical protein [Pyrinomonadaceae bacterium]MBA3569983.1 hypothetical protein [Pyrinomonadaceae bacterium]